MKKPLIKRCYKHFKGGYYVILGFAEAEETQTEVVIYANIDTGKAYTRPLEGFFAIHPKKNVPRFELVTTK